jgi:hypothetical protein
MAEALVRRSEHRLAQTLPRNQRFASWFRGLSIPVLDQFQAGPRPRRPRQEGRKVHSRHLLHSVWIDASMNKFAVILGPVLAGGIVVDERSRGMLDVLMAKPIRAVDYFTVKLAASSAAFPSFYLFGVGGALCTFPWRLKGFVVSDFLALSAAHFFAAIFAATFAGTIALFFKRKVTGLLVSIVILGTLVGVTPWSASRGPVPSERSSPASPSVPGPPSPPGR